MIEPRNVYIEKDDTIGKVEVNMGIPATDKAIPASPGSESMACLILELLSNLGDPAPLLKILSRVCPTTEEGGRQTRCRESDDLVVSVKAGNSAGEKEVTSW